MALWSKVEDSGTDGGLERSRHPLSESKELSSMSMLNTEKISNGSPAPAAGDLLLGKGARFEGKLTFQGTLRMDAVFVGTIFQGSCKMERPATGATVKTALPVV